MDPTCIRANPAYEGFWPSDRLSWIELSGCFLSNRWDEKPMAAVNLNTMDVDVLLALRADIDSMLHERSRELRAQLARLDGGRKNGGGRSAGPGTSVLKGVKVAPKYQGPDGETWAGRGARPRWLTAQLDQGRSLDEFAISQEVDAGPGESTKAPSARRFVGKKAVRRKKAA
jgi:DNA-binding protein H-NS